MIGEFAAMRIRNLISLSRFLPTVHAGVIKLALDNPSYVSLDIELIVNA
jgi:hypothetical protein